MVARWTFFYIFISEESPFKIKLYEEKVTHLVTSKVSNSFTDEENS